MHEFSVASNAVDRIMETARKRGAKRIREVEILLGELSLLGEDQFLFWMKEMLRTKGDIAQDVKIGLKHSPVVIKCNHCGYEGNVRVKDANHFYPVFNCPSCNQSDLQIEKGRECVLSKIQIQT